MIIIVNEIDMVIGRYYVANRKPQLWKQLFDAQLTNYGENLYIFNPNTYITTHQIF